MKKTFLFIFSFLFLASLVWGLSSGDIAFTAFNADGDDDFAIVVLADIPASSTIFFSDNEPNADGSGFLDFNEGSLEWATGGAVISAGSIVVFTDTDSGSNPNFGASVGTLSIASFDSGMNLSGGGDALYAVEGSPDGDNISAWLAGIQNETNNQGANFDQTGLTVGTTFINFYTSGSPDGGYYSGLRSGQASFSDYLTLLGNNSNWTTETDNGELILPISTTAFTIGANILPLISNITQTPATGITSSTTVSVSADVTDADGTISLVELHWGLSSGSLGTTISMSNGGSGDAYTTSSDIPTQSDGTTVYYEIYAEDDVPESSSSAEFSYFVSDAIGPILGDLIITEVCGDGVDPGSDNGFMEIFNTTSSTLSLANIQVRYYNTNPSSPTQTVDLSGVIAPNDYIIITQNVANFNAAYAPITADFFGSTFYFNGGDDGVDIYDTTSDAEILDSFNDNGVGHTPWTWNANNVFERTSTGDGALSGSWTEITTGIGTPGADNDNPLPVTLTEFSTAIIMNEFVQISWTTQSESSINVWNLYRETDDSAGQILINRQPGTNTTQPFIYIFEDHEVEEDVTYYYYLEVTEYDGSSNMWGPISAILEGSVTPELPITSMLQINYPNPFNPSTTIKCDIKEGEEGEFTIFNSRGQVIERQLLNAGEHIIEWDGTSYGSGVYLYKLESESYTKTRKMIMIK